MPNQNIPLLIKNMVCHRCIISVENILNNLNIPFDLITLGAVQLTEKPEKSTLETLQKELSKVGFELIESRITKIVEDIKLLVLQYTNLNVEARKMNLSVFITNKINYDYSYLSDIFSSVEGKSIEQYFILQRIEKVKELIVYDQLSLTEIANLTGFSSVHHLSGQFKKVTGLTPSRFKIISHEKRRSIDRL